jgi:hypothetical protein
MEDAGKAPGRGRSPSSVLRYDEDPDGPTVGIVNIPTILA